MKLNPGDEWSSAFCSRLASHRNLPSKLANYLIAFVFLNFACFTIIFSQSLSEGKNERQQGNLKIKTFLGPGWPTVQSLHCLSTLSYRGVTGDLEEGVFQESETSLKLKTNKILLNHFVEIFLCSSKTLVTRKLKSAAEKKRNSRNWRAHNMNEVVRRVG